MNLKLLGLIIFTTVSLLLHAQGRIELTVYNFRNNKGLCRACLFNSEASFNDKGVPLVCLEKQVARFQSFIVFEHIPQGTYAIMLFHDENNNGKLDKNFLGIPREGYGASGNRLPFAAAPGFHDNKFLLAKDERLQLKIRLRNL